MHSSFLVSTISFSIPVYASSNVISTLYLKSAPLLGPAFLPEPPPKSNPNPLNILENILSNKTYKVFLKKIDIKENAYINKIIIEYKKIILYPFRQNLKYIINNNKEINMMFHFLNINLNDDRELYNFLIECCNIRKNHQYILF